MSIIRLLRALYSPLFPYTTLFRSLISSTAVRLAASTMRVTNSTWDLPWPTVKNRATEHGRQALYFTCFSPPHRSEEHTSELQSPFNLVCCFLLDKNNIS